MDYILPVLMGIAAGICSGLFGIGGGIIIVPLLVFFYKFPQHSATATSLTALLLPTGALALWQYYQQGHLGAAQIKVGIFISLGMFAGALLGAKIAGHLQSASLTRIFSIFLFLIAIRLWFMAK